MASRVISGPIPSPARILRFCSFSFFCLLLSGLDGFARVAVAVAISCSWMLINLIVAIMPENT